jgi:hypothetical protein
MESSHAVGRTRLKRTKALVCAVSTVDVVEYHREETTRGCWMYDASGPSQKHFSQLFRWIFCFSAGFPLGGVLQLLRLNGSDYLLHVHFPKVLHTHK